ncbi:type I toxin-antitoxin system Fst family toxin [Vagococcus teuberi]|nr:MULTISPECIES: type I toxin-antitoxin system Fst family toxin [Vagococcus]RHH66862.1 type I toxin-antitoxin system Fst family toxin [Vagococcus sp. AM17-17]
MDKVVSLIVDPILVGIVTNLFSHWLNEKKKR